MLSADRILQHRYRILELLGEGGMGAVYRAMDQRLDTVVALKECFFSEEHLRKQFEREARLLARLRHPAMTRVIDHFTEEDGQFLVMEYIPGDDLHAMLKSRGSPFPPAQVRQWGDQLLDALTYLHGQEPQIIHRDIKPQNLKMIGSAQIILLDFGLAKSLANEVAQLTTSVSVLGYTPNYAPLEQIQGTGTDHRSDLYALGATLYHLITGIAPAAALARASALVNSQPDPLRPAHELNPEVPAPVSAALMEAMALDRNARFASAEQMRKALHSSADESTAPTIVERVSAESAVVALPVQQVAEPPPPAPERRRSNILIWLVLAFLLLVVGVCTYFFGIGKSPGDRQTGTESQAAMSPPMTENASPSAASAAPAISDSGAPQLTLTGHTKEVKSVAYAPDGASVATGSSDGTLKLWDARTGAVRQTLPQREGEIVAVAFSPDGNTLALALDHSDGKGQVSLLDCTTWQTTKQFAVDNINSLAFSPDGRTLAVGNISSSLNLWDVASGELKRTLEGQDIQTRSVAFSRDGKTIVGGGYGNTVKVWDAETGVVKRLLEGHQSEITAVAIAPNGKTIASGSQDYSAKVWDSETGTVLRTLSGLKTAAVAIAFSPDGALLAVADGSSVKLWEPQSGTVKQTLAGGRAPVVAFAFSPDGKTLAIAAGATVTLREVSAVK